MDRIKEEDTYMLYAVRENFWKLSFWYDEPKFNEDKGRYIGKREASAELEAILQRTESLYGLKNGDKPVRIKVTIKTERI